MSARPQVDSVLVIRAKDEATKAVTAIGSALQQLIGTQQKVAAGSETAASGMQQILGVLASLDKAYAKTAEATDSGAAALERQNRAIAASKAQYTSLEAQQRGAARAADQLRVALVEALLTNGNADALRAQIAEVTAEMRRLESEGGRLQKTIAQQEVGYTRAASGMAELERQTRLAGSVSTFAATEANDYARSLDNQSAAAQRNASVLKNIARVTGTDRGAAVDNGASFSALDGQAAKIEAAANAERDRAQATELTNNALRARGRIDGNGGSAGRAADTLFAQQLRDEEAAATEAAKADKELTAATARLRAELNPLGAIQEKLNTELAEANRLYKAGKISATELAGATALLKGNAASAAAALNGRNGIGAGGKPSLFGLKPYELQNLGYQANDIVTQLMSGTSLAQTLAQQGGQILQIFPRVGSAIVAAFTNPALIAFVVTVGAVVLALKNAGDEAERTRKFVGLLAASADGSTYGAKALSDASEALDHYGLSAADAVTVVRGFVKDGVDPSRIIEFGKASQDLADVLGIKVVDAAQQVGEAFTGGYESVRKLDDATNFLTSAQRDNIKSLFDQGKAADARNEALRIFSDQQEDAANKMRGSWSEAARSLGGAWQEFLNTLSDTAPIVEIARELEGLGRIASQAIRAIAGATTVGDISAQIARANQVISNLEGAKTAQPELAAGYEADIVKIRKQIVGWQADLAKLNGAQGKVNDTVTANSERQKKIDADIADADEDRLKKSKQLSDEKRIQVASEDAMNDALSKGASVAGARASAEVAATIERAKVEKENTAERTKQANEAKRLARELKTAEESAIKGVSSKIPAIESGGDPNATNSKSSATGLGQFIESTWLTLFRKYFPEQAASMSSEAILALRKDAETSKKLVEVYARENAAVLKKAGLSVTEANLYLTHFLGSAGATKVLKADPKASAESVLSSGAIKANPFLRGKTVGDVRAFAAKKVGDSSSAETAVTTRLYQIEQDRAKVQTDFDAKIADETEKRKQQTASLETQLNLTGAALLAEQRKQAIADAVLQKQQEVDKINADRAIKGMQAITYTEAQATAVRETAAAYFDAAHAKEAFEAQRNDVDKPVADITAQRDALRDQISFLRDNGFNAEADKLLPTLNAVNGQLQGAIDKAVEFYRALSPGNNPLGLTAAQLDTIVLKLDMAKASAQEWGTVLNISAEQIANAFANTLTSAVDGFVQAVEAGETAEKALLDAFLDFAGNFLRLIAQMILQQIALNIAKGILSAVGVAVPTPTNHNGGIAGINRSSTRMVDPGIFSAAARFHTGGIAGLRPDEVPIVAQKGEEILTRGDPRHRANGGLDGGGAAPNIKIVNAIDAGDFVSKGLDSGVGGKALMNFIRSNSGAIKQVIG